MVGLIGKQGSLLIQRKSSQNLPDDPQLSHLDNTVACCDDRFTTEEGWVEVESAGPARSVLAFRYAILFLNLMLYIAVMSFVLVPGFRSICLSVIQG